MNRKRKKPIIALVILVAIVVIVAPFSQLFQKAYANDGSTIAGINVSDMKEDEIRAVLNDAITAWSAAPPTIEGGGSALLIDPATFTFDVEATLTTFRSLTDKAWYAFWDKKSPVHISLEVANTEALKEQIEGVGAWDVEQTYALAIQQIVNLQSEPVQAIVTDTSILETERLAYITQDIPSTARSVYDMARLLDETIIGSGENFSLLQALNGASANTNEDGLSFVGSLIYRNALYTNTEITERHPQTSIPTYLESGLEALVNVNMMKDVSFTNKMDVPILMKFTVQGMKLKVEFFSSVMPNSVSVQVTKAGDINPREIIRYSKDLRPGAVRVMQSGEKGARVSVFRIVDGFEEQISRDYYPPTNRIVLKSSREPEPVVETNPDGTNNTSGQNGTTNDQTAPNGVDSEGNPIDPIDTIDTDGDGLPDINQGEGYMPKVDEEGNVIPTDKTSIDKSGEKTTSSKEEQ